MAFSLFDISSPAVQENYHASFMLFSYLMALFTTYVALDIAYNLKHASQPYAFKWWMIGGSLVLGVGIWSMHFIGMQAWAFPFTIKYDLYFTLLSFLIALISAGFAFLLILRSHPPFWQIIFIGLIVGLGIACMHYIGMAAMIELKIQYVWSFFVTSLFVVVLVSQVILWALIKGSQFPSKFLPRLGIASIIAFAMWCLHFAAMHGAHVSIPQTSSTNDSFINASSLSLDLLLNGFFILGIALAFQSYKVLIRSIQFKNIQLINAQKLLEEKGEQLEQMNQELIQAAHQAGIAQVTSGILHNIGNILNHVHTSAELLKERIDHTPLKELKNPIQIDQQQIFFKKELKVLLEQTDHIKDIIRAQQSLIQKKEILEKITWDDLLDNVISLFTNTFKAHHIQIIRELHFNTPFSAYKTKLLQIVVNLIQNAKDSLISDYTNKSKKLIVRSFIQDQQLILEVEDNGIGMDNEQMNHIFEFGFTTKPQGHGFGLHASLILVKEMHGSLTGFNSKQSKGAIFRLELPLPK